MLSHMHSLKHSKIQKQMFIFYAALILAVLILVLLMIVLFFNTLIKDTSGEALYQTAAKFGSDIDGIIEKLDGVARRVVFSDSISQDFLTGKKDKSILLPLSKRREITNELYSILGPNITFARQINLIDCETGNYIGVGTAPRETIVSRSELSQMEGVSTALERQGLLTVVPNTDREQAALNTAPFENCFSVIRALKSPLRQVYTGVVEVPVRVSEVEALAKQLKDANHNIEDVFIFTKDGKQVYSTGETDSSSTIGEISLGNDEHVIYENDKIITYVNSNTTDWYIMLQANNKFIQNPIGSLYLRLVLIIAISMIAVLILSYHLSNRFTRPLRAIYVAIKQVSFIKEKWETLHLIDNNKNELEELQVFFEALCSDLDDAINESVMARTYEMEARKKALEAQINPHFLYNTFAIIQSYADNANLMEISEICDNVSSILRYAVSEDSRTSTVGSEINVCLLYMELMYKRNYDKLSYSVNIDEKIVHKHMPKMILQPLVENCFKHGLMKSDKWQVDIRGYCEGDSWYIEVGDNGTGMDEKTIKKIYSAIEAAQLRDSDNADNVPEGIGLVNIGVRMKLHFGDKTVFNIKNKLEGGCLITIGVKDGIKDDT